MCAHFVISQYWRWRQYTIWTICWHYESLISAHHFHSVLHGMFPTSELSPQCIVIIYSILYRTNISLETQLTYSIYEWHDIVCFSHNLTHWSAQTDNIIAYRGLWAIDMTCYTFSCLLSRFHFSLDHVPISRAFFSRQLAVNQLCAIDEPLLYSVTCVAVGRSSMPPSTSTSR